MLIPLTPDERALLKESLRRHGCLHALIAWRENGRLLVMDGNNRFELCAELGIGFKFVEIELESRAHAKIWIRKNQLGRRNLPDDARAMLAAMLSKELAKLSLVERAKEAGKVGGRHHPKKSQLGDHSGLQAEKGKKSKGRVRAAVAKQARVSQRRVRAALALEKRAVELVGEDAAQEICDAISQARTTIAKANRELGKAAAAKKLAVAKRNISMTTASEAAKLVRCCSMEQLLGEFRNSLDAIVCDPPYGERHLELYGQLARAAKTALKRNGILVVMTGQQHLPRVLADMCEHMFYRWILRYETGPSPATAIYSRKVNTTWKPVLAFSPDEASMKDADWICSDLVRSDAAEKNYDEWQQSVSGTGKLIEYVTKPSHLVCDPCCGTGTTGVAAIRLGRRFVGCDIDASKVKIAQSRIALELVAATRLWRPAAA